MHAALYNARKLTLLLKAMQMAFLVMSLTLSALCLYLLYGWQRALHADVAYFVSCEGIHVAYKRAQKPCRDHLELAHFTRQFLGRAFAHSEFTYKEHLSAALLTMDRPSGLFLKSKFSEEALTEVYKLQGGVSTVQVQKVQSNTQDYPYEVVAYYETTLHFVGSQEVQKVQSGVYFRLTEVPRSPENPYGLIISHFKFIAHEHP